MPTRNLVPNVNNDGSIGLNGKRWAAGHFQTLKVSGKDLSPTDHVHSSSQVTDFEAAAIGAATSAFNTGSLIPKLKASDGSVWVLGVNPNGQVFTAKQ